MDRSEPSEEEPFNSIHVEISLGRHSSEDFEVRKYPEGNVKAFWWRHPTYSRILDEDLDDELVEVEMTPERVKRIAQILVSAHGRTMAEANSTQGSR